MKVFLVGYMGVGKTSLGKKIASKLKSPFIDLDHIIEEREGMPIPEIWKAKSEAYFREREAAVLSEFTADSNSFVMSTGGGTPCFGDNMQLMLDRGVVVWLQLDAAQLVSRLTQSGNSRPLIAGKSHEELETFVKTSLKERTPFYSQAHIHFSAHNANAERIEKLVEEIYSR